VKEIIIKTQKELDAAKDSSETTFYIEGGTQFSPLELTTDFKEAYVIVRGQAWVRLRESSHAELRESSHAELRGSSHAVLRESSHAVLWESSHAVLWGEALVSAFSAKEIVAHGYNVISLRKSAKKTIKLVVGKNATLKIVPDFKPTFKEFALRYPVEVKGKNAIMYKAVHKRDGKYFSDYSSGFEYEIGKEKTHDCAPSSDGSCAPGLHVSHKSWARGFGGGWIDFALLECEVPIKSIVVSKDTDGKVRTSKLTVLREVPASEYWQ